MTAIAGPDWPDWKVEQDASTTLRLPNASESEGSAMREKLFAVRDTLIVLSLQLVFRAVMFARRWNY